MMNSLNNQQNTNVIYNLNKFESNHPYHFNSMNFQQHSIPLNNALNSESEDEIDVESDSDEIKTKHKRVKDMNKNDTRKTSKRLRKNSVNESSSSTNSSPGKLKLF